MRIGIGYDAHRLKEGRECVLCGVRIPASFGPDGHSDADVPLHALMDAMLGAAALGDIGNMFPDSEEQWRDADSTVLLRLVSSAISQQGLKLGNADITIVLEKPRLSPYIMQMRETVAAALSVPVGKISVKATTEEEMGFTGNGIGVSSSAVVLLEDI